MAGGFLLVVRRWLYKSSDHLRAARVGRRGLKQLCFSDDCFSPFCCGRNRSSRHLGRRCCTKFRQPSTGSVVINAMLPRRHCLSKHFFEKQTQRKAVGAVAVSHRHFRAREQALISVCGRGRSRCTWCCYAAVSMKVRMTRHIEK